MKEKLLETIDLTENNSHVICYRKTINLHKKTISRLNIRIKGIYYFFRLNLVALMFYADERDDMFRILTHDLRLAWTNIPKIYKVELILKASVKSKPKLASHYHHYQILVSRQGIHIINPIDLEGDVPLID